MIALNWQEPPATALRPAELDRRERAEYARRVAAAAPVLSADQRRRLSGLLGGGRVAAKSAGS